MLCSTWEILGIHIGSSALKEEEEKETEGTWSEIRRE
jgi:hypothetical protein|tara:strand:- start:1323 stop:1433 length:111 start_codon:yes stop_codon:yes gene_type:complete